MFWQKNFMCNTLLLLLRFLWPASQVASPSGPSIHRSPGCTFPFPCPDTSISTSTSTSNATPRRTRCQSASSVERFNYVTRVESLWPRELELEVELKFSSPGTATAVTYKFQVIAFALQRKVKPKLLQVIAI